MDLTGQDACDMAKANGLSREITAFNNCNPYEKVLPLMPDGKHAEIEAMVFFPGKEPEALLQRNPFKFRRQGDLENEKDGPCMGKNDQPKQLLSPNQ